MNNVASGPSTVIDRDERTRLAELIRRYLAADLTAFNLDEALNEFRIAEDVTVQYVADALWYHYDDVFDHLVNLEKPEWDYIQRLLLLIESNSTVTITRTKSWHYSQGIALLLLLVCLGLVSIMGFGTHLLIWFIPLGIGSILLSRFRRATNSEAPFNELIFPFQSIGDLRVAYKSTQFHKVHYPTNFPKRIVRHLGGLWFQRILAGYLYLLWLLLAPFPLFWQCFPAVQTQIEIKPA